MGDPAPEAASCAPALRTLRAELLERVSGSITRPGPVQLDDWDQRFYRARPSCTEGERPAFTELNRLRYGLGALSERFEREELPHLERLDELLGPELQHAQATPPKKTHE